MDCGSIYDVIILGGGAGGSLLAAILARSGMSVAMIDRASHPRFTIGESSTPSADLILHSLAQKYDLPELLPLTRFGLWRQRCPEILCGCKRGFSYFRHGSDNEFTAGENHQGELLVTANVSRELADTQWYRPDVDQFLAGVAVSSSAHLFENAEDVAIEHSGICNWRVSFRRKSQQEKLNSRFIIDATGGRGVLLDFLQVPDVRGQLQTNSSAIFGHWENVTPAEKWLEQLNVSQKDYPFHCDDSAIHHLFHDGWMWQLRFENGLTSLGFLSKGNFSEEIASVPADEAWELLLKSKPSLEKLLSHARLAAFPGKVYFTGRLQRLRNCGAGQDWAALPYTIGFIDPLHSTGLAHTFSGIERLSQIFLEQSAGRRQASLKKYSEEIISELSLIDLLVAGCYESLDSFPLFTAWTMLYFAAATSYEKNRLSGKDQQEGFLCASDVRYASMVQQLFRELKEISRTEKINDLQHVENFIAKLSQQLEPYNHVGLFEPDIPNMYCYTSAQKPELRSGD